MKSIDVYHRLPSRLRNWAASFYGRRLWKLRYGAETDSRADEALRTERRPAEENDAVQADRLRDVLRRAVERVPYYREVWRRRRAQGYDPSRLADWPILEKEQLRASPERFLADDVDRRELIAEHTSGTTGTPLHLWWDRAATQRHYALFEARWRRWYGVSRFDRWAMLGGRLVASMAQTRPPFWVWNAPMRQLYMSSYHLSPELTPYYLDALKRYEIRYLWGYTSSLYSLAQDVLRLGLDRVPMTVAVTNAEPLYDFQRAAIAEAFHCPVRETYGMSELVACAGECERGRLHLWPETGVVEVLEDARPLEPGVVGDLICTGLLNDAMPLIRYRVGDRGSRVAGSMPCACGRTLPMLGGIEGRLDDVLLTPDGRRIGRLDTVFKADWPIREAQIIQDRPDEVRLRFVPTTDFSEASGAGICRELQSRLHGLRVILEPVDRIERTANGKFRAVVNRCKHAEVRTH